MKSAISLDSHLSLSKAGVNAISIFSILSLIRGSSTGSLKSRSLKYLTSLNNLVRAGSKFTLRIPISSLVNNGYFNFSYDDASTSFSHYKILFCSYSFIALAIELNSF